MSEIDWCYWLRSNINCDKIASPDYGLSEIAKFFGEEQEEGLRAYWQGSVLEQAGELEEAIKCYKRAFKKWPALDSVTSGGLPLAVRREAETQPALVHLLLDNIDVKAAQGSRVVKKARLLNAEDIAQVEQVRLRVLSQGHHNAENDGHFCKKATFLNNPPGFALQREAPNIVGKMIDFAANAWADADWSGSSLAPGPLFALKKSGVPALSIRVIERWAYEPGGGLSDPFHYDTDSVLTLVVLLNSAGDFTGGEFRTLEADGKMRGHDLEQGDCICFVSHKYHNIVPLLSGSRISLVMELWQGGVGHLGR
jgi:hypothetical protein